MMHQSAPVARAPDGSLSQWRTWQSDGDRELRKDILTRMCVLLVLCCSFGVDGMLNRVGLQIHSLQAKGRREGECTPPTVCETGGGGAVPTSPVDGTYFALILRLFCSRSLRWLVGLQAHYQDPSTLTTRLSEVIKALNGKATQNGVSQSVRRPPGAGPPC